METIRDQIKNKCIHFTGLSNKRCAMGVKYEDVKDKNKRPIKIPCLKNIILSGSSCEKACFPTNEYVEKEVKEIERIGTEQVKAYAAVKSHIDETGERQGIIECTLCGGDLKYTQAECNGHIWAKCKCGLGWME